MCLFTQAWWLLHLPFLFHSLMNFLTFIGVQLFPFPKCRLRMQTQYFLPGDYLGLLKCFILTTVLLRKFEVRSLIRS